MRDNGGPVNESASEVIYTNTILSVTLDHDVVVRTGKAVASDADIGYSLLQDPDESADHSTQRGGRSFPRGPRVLPFDRGVRVCTEAKDTW